MDVDANVSERCPNRRGSPPPGGRPTHHARSPWNVRLSNTGFSRGDVFRRRVLCAWASLHPGRLQAEPTLHQWLAGLIRTGDTRNIRARTICREAGAFAWVPIFDAVRRLLDDRLSHSLRAAILHLYHNFIRRAPGLGIVCLRLIAAWRAQSLTGPAVPSDVDARATGRQRAGNYGSTLGNCARGVDLQTLPALATFRQEQQDTSQAGCGR